MGVMYYIKLDSSTTHTLRSESNVIKNQYIKSPTKIGTQ